MNCRPHGRKHTLALWMLVALADAVLVVASAGALTILLIALAVALMAGAIVAIRLLRHRHPHPVAAVTQGRRSWQEARAQTEGRGWRESRA
jgi:hypothetical protein